MASLGEQYHQYDEYKESGVEWLNKVPKHWKTVPIKYLASEKDTLFLDGDWIESKDISDDGIRYITTGNVGEGQYKEQGTGFISDQVFQKLNCSEVFEKDILISRLNLPIGRACIVPNLNNRIVTSVDNVILRPDSIYSKNFLVYLFSSAEYFYHTANLARGATMQRISRGLLGNIRISLPEKEEQIKIANFLDHETAQIDTLIEKQQTLIQLLKEKRQAVISHAVTKGLNSDAPMKDSGVEWLGEVPAHWEVTRIKYITSVFEQGWSPQCDSRPAESNEYGVLKVGCVNYGSFHSIENKALPPELQPRLQYLIEIGDLLISRANTKELVGSAAVVDKDYNNLLLCDKLYRLRFNPNIQPELIALYLSIEPVREQIELQASGASSSMQNISQDVIKELPCFLLPNEEAYELLNYLNEKMNIFDNLIEKAEQAIKFIQERRTALISAAVTGKIDVRGWVE